MLDTCQIGGCMEERIPSWLWHIILRCTEDSLGEKGMNTILRRAHLEKHIGVRPPQDDTPAVTLDELSQYTQALFDIFGEDGAKPVLLRSGRLGYTFAQDHLPVAVKLAIKALSLLPEKERLVQLVSGFIENYNEIMNIHGSVSKEGEKIIVKIPDSAYSRNISTENPACYIEVGILSALIKDRVGPEYTVKETTCTAKGDPVCRFEIEKVK